MPVSSSYAAPPSGTEDGWHCEPSSKALVAPPVNPELKPGQTTLTANEVVSQSGGISIFSGDVVVQSDGRTLQGDRAQYDQQSGEVSVDGNIQFHAEELSMRGARASMRLEEESGEFDDVSFFFPQHHAYGSAKQLTRNDQNHSTLRGVSYTTCNPEKEDWRLSASKLKLDQESNTGEAYNTVFRFKGMPIFYSPYLNFPLSGRKSGLLPPTIGSSQSSGNDVQLPVYWNMAPNYDATITPRYLSKRGFMVMNEFRMLTERSSGQVQVDYLHDDELYGDSRNYLALDHNARFGRGWSSSLKLRGTSDALYLSDIGTQGSGSSTSHLERRLDVGYNDKHWKFLARAQGYQTLTGDEPYQRLPSLFLRGRSSRHPNRLQFTLQSEAVAFAHETLTPTGTRLDLKPAVSLPLQGNAWFFTPTAAWRYTDYMLEDYPQGEQFNRTLPIYSLDSGLYFDRETTLAGTNLTHTLEPRLYYLSVPYEDQDALPLFDTGNSDFNFSQLFRDNRFNGPDRQGDAEQLTAALTTRLIDDGNGSERLRASIGRIYYFDDRQVTLSAADPVETVSESDIFAELELRPIDKLRLGLDIQYDSEQDLKKRLNGHIRYRDDHKHQLGLDLRYNRAEQIKQGDLLVFWPVARQWQFLGRWRHDINASQDLDILAGLEYQSCCWAIRLLGRNQRTIDDDIDRSIYLTFEFRGLGSLGAKLEDALGEELLTNE